MHPRNSGERILSSDVSIQPIVIVVGTRPEGIKMIPVYKALRDVGLPVLLCSTMQHDELLSQVFDLFGVQPDFDLQIMRQGQDLFYVTQAVLHKIKEIFKTVQPSMVLVQGDTTSTMAAALAAFYLGISVCHIEAGLRTDDIRAPFPEEMNRRVIGIIADIHCAPTSHAAAQLLSEGIERKKVFCTGNTVVDALRILKQEIKSGSITVDQKIDAAIQNCKKQNKKIMLLTVHRRESFNGGVVRILQAVKDFLQEHDDLFCFYPFHPNPHVMSAIEQVGLSDLENIYLTEPIAYTELAHLLFNVDVVVTDSGGIQEEGVSLGRPVLVLREKTERAEGVWAGLATIVGSDQEKIKTFLYDSLYQNTVEQKQELQVYGDGYAAERIAHIIKMDVEKTKTISKKDFIKFEKRPEKVERGVEGMKKVSVLGLGYIGLPTSLVMAEAGLSVSGFDVDGPRVEAINSGDPVIQEPEIFEKLQLVLGSGKFCATTQLEPADYFVIAVPTPFHGNKKADLSYVFAAADSIATVLAPGNTVLLESTVPVGTTDALAHHLQKKTGMSAGKDFFVAHCPERVLPGKIFYELVHNARVIGGVNQPSAQNAKELYQTFVTGDLYVTDAKTAEMVKLVENSSRDVEIAFAHQVASMAYSVGLDPYTVIELANRHPRVHILQPSCGVGGHCIAVDPWFLIESFKDHSNLLQAARHVNDEKPQEILAFIRDAVNEWEQKNKKRCTVLTLGLTYKPNVDDLRESPALLIAQTLAKDESFNLLVCEPHINKKKLQKLFGDRVVTAQEGADCADIVVYLVAHKRFKAIDEKLLHAKQVLDFCGVRHEKKEANGKDEFLFWPASRALKDSPVMGTKEDEISKRENVL